MYAVPWPHMVCNGTEDFPPFGRANILMWQSYFVPEDHSCDQILGWTAQVARTAPGGMLRTLVFACHGLERSNLGGYGLQIGTGIRRVDTPRFSVLYGLVEKIIIFACKAAQIGTATEPGSTMDGDGNLFCCEIAKASGAYVQASTADQYNNGSWGVTGGSAVGYMPEWSGMVLTYGPDGSVVESKNYSLW